MQDDIVARLANQLQAELIAAEAHRAERSSNHYFLGLALFKKGQTAAHLDKARTHFDRALELDPDNVGASVGQAAVDLSFVGVFLSDDRAERLRSAEAKLGKALRLRPDSATAHVNLGHVRCRTNRIAQGVAECERALAIDRNLAGAHVIIGMAKYLTGRADETEAHVVEALRISPRDSYAGQSMAIAGIGKVFAGHDEEAVVRLSRSIELNPNFPIAHFHLAGALARCSRLDEARQAAGELEELEPYRAASANWVWARPMRLIAPIRT